MFPDQKGGVSELLGKKGFLLQNWNKNSIRIFQLGFFVNIYSL